MRLLSCVQACFLGLGVEVNNAFQTSSLVAKRRVRLPTTHNPRESNIATATTVLEYNRLGIPSSQLFNAALEINVADDTTEHHLNNTSSNNNNNGGVEDDGSIDYDDRNNNNNEAYDPIPICRVVAASDGKIPPLPVLATASSSTPLSSSSKSLLEKIELLYSVRSQKELRNLAYMLPRSTTASNNNNDYCDELEYANDNVMSGGELPNSRTIMRQEEKLVSILKQSLEDGGFKRMDQRDLDLCSALNAGYLLRLSLYPDNKELDPCIGKEFYPELYVEDEDGEEEEGSDGRRDTRKGKKKDDIITLLDNKLLFDGRVLIFRRGYSKEISTGRLLLPKLDYLQASLVQRSSTALTRKLGALEQQLDDLVHNTISQLNDVVERVYLGVLQQFRDFTVNIVDSFGLSKNEFVAGIISKNANAQSNNITSDGTKDKPRNKTSSVPVYNVRGNKIFKLTRYRTSTSSIIPDALDLNDALTPFLLCELPGANATNTTVEQDMYDGMETGKITCQYDDTLFSLPKRNDNLEGRSSPPSEQPSSSFSKPAVRLLERVSIQNTVDFFSKKGRRELLKNYFKSSTLVEPAYEEVVVVWRPLRKKKPKKILPPKWMYEVAKVFDAEDRLPRPKSNNTTRGEDGFDDDDDVPMPLEIKAFYDVPMANIEAVLPKTKLVFRPADAIVFDLVSVVSFLAIAGSLKFDSPRLDLIALISLIFFAVRTFFRYSNKYARYDLLVNKFLTSKLAHRGPGALKYIVSEANSNKALRAMLTRDWLSKWDISQSITDVQFGAILEQGRSHVSKMSSNDSSRIDVDIKAALVDLRRLKLIDEYEVKEEQKAQDSIKQLWNDTFE